jgi:uncharacterized protein (DUF169 family)
MTDLARIAETLQTSLNLRTAPVAVCVMDAPPSSVPAHRGAAAAGCQFWGEGAAQAFSTTPVDHENCSIGMYTHHMTMGAGQQADLTDALQVMGDLGYVRPADLPLIPVLQSEAKAVVYSPLGDAPKTPDVVLLFANYAQGLVISEAAQQVESGIAPVLGRPACGVVPQVANSGKAALSLGCCGARAYVDALGDDMAVWALPGAEIAAYTDRIDALSKANGILAKFHSLRRADVAAGQHPTVKDSLARLQG